MYSYTGALSSQYFYDGDGHRVKRIIGTAETWQVYGISGELPAEYPVNTAASTPSKEYGYRSGQLLVTAEGSSVKWLVADHLGTPRMVVDKSGDLNGTNKIIRHDYLPFGEELGAGVGLRNTTYGYDADTVRQKFTSYERDNESELDFAEARYYNFNHGRFTTSDPLLASGRIEDPQTWNRYAYVLNNPLNYIDPTGLYECRGNKTQCDQFETRLGEAKDNLKKIEAKYGKDSRQYEKASKSISSRSRNSLLKIK